MTGTRTASGVEARERRAFEPRHASTAALLVLWAAATSSEAAAQADADRFELTPYAGYRFGGTFEDRDGAADVGLDDDASLGLIFDIREDEDRQWEIIYSRQDAAADTSGLTGFAPATDVRIHYLHGGGTYQWQQRAVRPYVTATLGGAHVDPSLPELGGDTFWSISLGVGMQLRSAARVGIRLEARVFGTLVDSDSALFCRSGTDGGACAIQVDGRMFWQVETAAGLVFRF